MAGKKFGRYIFYTYFNISIINFFICFKKSKSTHVCYSLLSYKNALLHAFINPYSKSVFISIPIVKSDSFIRVVTSDVVPGNIVVVYSNKRCVYCPDVLIHVQKTSYECDVCRVSLCYYKGTSIDSILNFIIIHKYFIFHLYILNYNTIFNKYID